ncbi:hypothetical protein BHM03_00012089 [Ensete ventricosum]|nr:hypothetical protein BHM03_00012089 [Ensete ventricosum]
MRVSSAIPALGQSSLLQVGFAQATWVEHGAIHYYPYHSSPHPEEAFPSLLKAWGKVLPIQGFSTRAVYGTMRSFTVQLLVNPLSIWSFCNHQAKAENPRVPIVPLSFGGVAPDDSGATQALATMQSCFDVDSTVTARRLIEVRKHYYIPSEYELHVPLPGQRPYDAFSSGFSLSTNTLEVG